MLALLLLTIGVPFLLLLIAALFARVSQKRNTVALARGLRIALISGAAIALLVFVIGPRAYWLVALLTQQAWSTNLGFPDSPFQFALPLVVGSVAVAATLFAPTPQDVAPVSANLTRRSIFFFSRRSTFIWIATLGALAVLAALIAGPTATQDEYGNSRLIMFDSGSGTVGTETYGWYFSVPALGALGLLMATAILALRRIAAPPLQLDAERDLSARRVASQLVGFQVIAAILFHLAQILQMFNTVGSVSGSFSTPAPGGATLHQIWSPLAALNPGLLFVSLAASSAAVFVWAFVFWRAAFACSSASATPHESPAR